MTALHVLGADHFWSNVPMYLALSLFVFLGAIALRSKLKSTLEEERRSDSPTQGDEGDKKDS
jgi:hypothetical protein